MSANNNDPAIPTPEKQFEILAGGTEVIVHYKAGGDAERIKVRKIAIRDIGKLADVLGKEDQEVAFYCGKDLEWVELLHDDSFEALIEEGRRLNFTRYTKWAKRQMDLLKAMGQDGKLQRIFDEATDKAVKLTEAARR